MLRDQLLHLKHADALLLEDFLQLLVADDRAPVLLVLQVPLFDVFPDLFHHLCRGGQDGSR